MQHTTDLECVGVWTHKEDPIIRNAQPKFFSSLEGLYVAYSQLCEALKHGENMHGEGFAQAADIAFRRIGPDDALHFGS